MRIWLIVCFTGLSDRIEIVSYFVIKLNVFAEIESNWMQIESNDFFDLRYDWIRFDLEENVRKKNSELWR
jgi:hypothetical protein